MKNTILKVSALLVLLPFFAAKCEKEEEPDLPACDYVFECKVNGQTWKPKGSWNNPELSIYYSPDTIGNWIGGNMLVSAQNHVQGWVGSSHLVISLDSLYQNTKPVVSHFFYIYVDEPYASIPVDQARAKYSYDSIVASSIVIHEFVPDNYSKDWQRGYINMNFSATLMNSLGDSVNITNGKICQRFQ
jgi:hypothetical protein